jgi:hypothetical protein
MIRHAYFRDRGGIDSAPQKKGEYRGLDFEIMVEVWPDRAVNLAAALKLKYVTEDEARAARRNYLDPDFTSKPELDTPPLEDPAEPSL